MTGENASKDFPGAPDPLSERVPRSGVGLAGRVYVCRICGAELSVIKGGHGRLAPVCCNAAMTLVAKINSIYRCPVCGSEITVISGFSKSFSPVCCNTDMLIKVLGKAA